MATSNRVQENTSEKSNDASNDVAPQPSPQPQDEFKEGGYGWLVTYLTINFERDGCL